ncbi:MAG: hypothetical protein ACLU99_13025 [Alphaproteobacteria bacterium]
MPTVGAKGDHYGTGAGIGDDCGQAGFTLNEWAYTCDKTIKAYRLSKISSGMAMAIRGYQSGLHDDDIRKLSPRSQQSRYSTMQAIVEMYKAPSTMFARFAKTARN